MIGRIGDGVLELEQVARFPNGPVADADGSLHWDFSALRGHIVAGRREALRREPFHYRDERTAAGVEAVPMTDAAAAAYISCGTWGLVGVELDEPVVTDAAREANFTNEGGVDGRIRFLHNVTGLWLLSESVRAWEAESGETIDLPALLADAAAVEGEIAVFDANDESLSAAGR